MSGQVQVNPFFSPTQISGCTVWLDAADSSRISLSGSNVTSIIDKAQNINFTTQGNSSFLTLAKQINGNQTLYFNNTAANNVYMRGSVNNLLTGSFFVVWQATTQQGIGYRPFFCPVYTGSSNYPVFGYVNNAANSVGPYTSFGGTGSPLTIVSVGTNYLTFYSWVSATTSVGYNGATPTPGTQPAYASSSTQLDIMNESAAQTASGYIGEMVFYNVVLTTTQRQQVEGYLAWKWGLQGNLPANHPYKNTPIPPLLYPRTPTASALFSSWQPTQIPGLISWIDGADASLMSFSGSDILSITDKVVPSRSYVPTLGNFTYIQDQGRWVINIPNTTYMTCTTNLPVTANISWLFVVTKLATTNDAYLINFAPGTTNEAFRYGYTGKYIGGPGAPGDINDLITPGQSYINGSFNTATTYTDYHQINGPIQTTRTTTSITISSDYLSRYYVGTLAEFLFYSGPITNLQRQQIEGYLAQKWGLQSLLPQNHPYRTAPIPLLNTIPNTFPVSVSASWQPISIPGLQYWFDATDGSTIARSGTSLTSWTNKGSAGGSITVNVGTATTGTTVQNGLNLIILPAGTELIFTGSFPNQARTRFFATKPTVNTTITSVNFLYQNKTATNGNDSCGIESSTLAEVAQGLIVNLQSATISNQQNIFSVYTFANARSSITNNRLAITGSSLALPTNLTAGSYNTASATNYINANGTNTSAQQLGEWISYNSELTLQQIQQVEGYLAWKWGLQNNLPANHPFRRWPPPPR